MGLKDFLGFGKKSAATYSNIGGVHEYIYDSVSFSSGQPFLIDTSNGKLKEHFKKNPYLQLVLETRANMLSGLTWKHYRKDEDITDNSDYIKLLNNPNPLESKEEFIKKLDINFNIYGAGFIYKNKVSSSKVPKTIQVLPSECIKVVPTGKYLDQLEIKGIVKRYEWTKYTESRNKEFEPDEVIFLKDHCIDHPLKPISKLISLQLHLSNISSAMESRNVLINDRGARGILSLDNKSVIPMLDEEKDMLSNRLKSKHGLKFGKNSIMLTTAPLKWQQITENVKNLMLFEEVADDFKTIIDSFGLNLNIFSSDKGSTFENYKESMKGIYQNTIIPHANNISTKLTQGLNLPIDERIVAEFDLPILKKDEALEAEKLNKQAEALGKWKEILDDADFKKLLEKTLNL